MRTKRVRLRRTPQPQQRDKTTSVGFRPIATICSHSCYVNYPHTMKRRLDLNQTLMIEWLFSGLVIDFRSLARICLCIPASRPCAALTFGVIVVHQHPVGRPFHIVELTAAQRPPEQKADQETNTTEIGTRIYIVSIRLPPSLLFRCKRIAFNTTSSELADIPIPAIHGVTIPIIAKGMARRL